MIVVDTSVLVDHLRGRAQAKATLQRAVRQDELLAASVLTKVEIMAGMRNDERGATAALFRGLEWLPVSDEVAVRAGALARRFRRSHGSVDVVDYVVAASAHVHHAELWTMDVKHFPMVEGLRPPH